MRRYLIVKSFGKGLFEDNCVIDFDPESHLDSEAVKFALVYTHPGNEYEMRFTNDAEKATDLGGELVNVSYLHM